MNIQCTQFTVYLLRYSSVNHFCFEKTPMFLSQIALKLIILDSISIILQQDTMVSEKLSQGIEKYRNKIPRIMATRTTYKDLQIDTLVPFPSFSSLLQTFYLATTQAQSLTSFFWPEWWVLRQLSCTLNQTKTSAKTILIETALELCKKCVATALPKIMVSTKLNSRTSKTECGCHNHVEGVRKL